MCAFVVLGLVLPYQAKRLTWGKGTWYSFWNDLFCAEWDAKPEPVTSNCVVDGEEEEIHTDNKVH